MAAEELGEKIEEISAELDGENLRYGVENLLEEKGAEFSLGKVGGFDNPEHKEYHYTVEFRGDEFWLKVFVKDGRSSYPESHVESKYLSV